MWSLSETPNGEIPTFILATGEKLKMFGDEQDAVSSIEINFLIQAAFGKHEGNLIPLRLVRFGFVDRNGRITEDGQEALENRDLCHAALQ